MLGLVGAEVTTPITILVAAATVAGALGIAWPILRSKTLQTTNEMLSTALEQERRERQELEHRCHAENAELRGRVAVLTDGFAGQIAGAITTSLVEAGVLPGRRHRDT